MKELNDYLFQVVQNARKCNHCALHHDDGICFFAYECIKYDFHYYKEEEKMKMKVYYVTETITETGEENACGIYSTKQKAKDAILARVAQEYTPEEMKHFKFFNDVYVTETNDWVEGCAYTIDEIKVDAELG